MPCTHIPLSSRTCPAVFPDQVLSVVLQDMVLVPLVPSLSSPVKDYTPVGVHEGPVLPDVEIRPDHQKVLTCSSLQLQSYLVAVRLAVLRHQHSLAVFILLGNLLTLFAVKLDKPTVPGVVGLVKACAALDLMSLKPC